MTISHLSRPARILAMTLLAIALNSCFTGVESTPRITAKDIKKRNVTVSPESRLLADILPLRPSAWAPGMKFYPLDQRVTMIFEQNADSTPDIPLHKPLTLTDIGPRASITGHNITILTFATDDGRVLKYNTGIEHDRLNSLDDLNIPFTVQAALIDSIGSRLTGRHLFVLPARRFSASGTDTTALRYAPVTITGITPGDANYPVRVSFSDADGTQFSLMMTIGNSAASTRNFDKLFSFDDPRQSYPMITDEVWQLIKESRIRTGMSPQECRLALGAPSDIYNTPSTAGIIERWSYDNGIYLIFEDGALVRYRY